MGWRKKMGTGETKVNPNPYIQKVQNIQKVEEKGKNKTIAPFVHTERKNQNVRTYRNQFDSLWKKACKLADWIDDSKSDVPWQERAEKVPELQKMSMMLDELKMIMGGYTLSATAKRKG